MKRLFIISLITFLYGCGYTSVYNDQEKKDLLINIKNMQGDTEMNTFIKNELKIASDLNSNNIYNISYNTEYKKITLAKDTTGKATDFRLDMSVRFLIISNENKEISFNENFKIKDNDENFDQKNYEKEIKKNFSKIIRDKLILYLLTINDN